MVNTQELRGSWNRVKGQVREKWGVLTDDDLQIQGGNMDQLVGKIQQKTGETREAVEGFLDSLTSKGASVLDQAAEAAGQFAQRAGDQIRDRYQEVAERVDEGYEQAGEMVRRSPVQSVAASFGIGLALGVMVGLALRSR